MGWLFDRENTNAQRFVPDLLADRDIARIDRWFPALTVVTLLSPALIGGLVTMSWWGALTAFFWASLVRVAVLHHVTWSVNSLCHMIGDRPYAARDKSANFWPLAIASMGESWHNSHHADPTSARHGVRRGQLDMSARLIWLFEKLGWPPKSAGPSPNAWPASSTPATPRPPVGSASSNAACVLNHPPASTAAPPSRKTADHDERRHAEVHHPYQRRFPHQGVGKVLPVVVA